MRNTLAIARKELTVYFTTPFAYVGLAMFTLLGSWMFLSMVGAFQRRALQAMTMNRPQLAAHMNLTDMVMTPLVMNLAIVLILIVVPFLSMRLIAEEKRQSTMELLLTTPIRPVEIVFGKYLAAVTMLVVALGLTLGYPLLLSVFGQSASGSAVEWPTVLSGYLGLALLGAGFLAVGLFVSSLTENAMVAGLITAVIGLMFWVVGWKAQDLHGTARAVMTWMSMLQHLVSFARGLLNLKDVAYYLSFLVLGLFLAHRAVEGQRWTA